MKRPVFCNPNSLCITWVTYKELTEPLVVCVSLGDLYKSRNVSFSLIWKCYETYRRI
jgi:hypothetical protein